VPRELTASACCTIDSGRFASRYLSGSDARSASRSVVGPDHAREPLGVRARLDAREVPLGREVELLEHPRLPRGHRRGRGRGHVDHREEVKVAEALAAAEALAKLGDRRDVVEVAVRGHVVHEEVIADELPRVRDVFGRRVQARQDAIAELGAGAGVVLSRAGGVGVALADVVEQRREKERPRARGLGREPRRERELVRELTPREETQPVEGGDGVNVDGVHMVDVVVDAAGHGSELRDHREEEAGVMHPADDRAARRGALVHRAYELDEELRRFRRRA
jgi:hypothetical protein